MPACNLYVPDDVVLSSYYEAQQLAEMMAQDIEVDDECPCQHGKYPSCIDCGTCRDDTPKGDTHGE